MGKGSTIRILVVDDYKPWQEFVDSHIGALQGMQIVGRASDGLEAVRKAKELQPDLILLDIGLPKLNGIEAALRIRQCAPQACILFVSETRDAEIVDVATATGAVGYIAKSKAAKELLPALRSLRCCLAQDTSRLRGNGNGIVVFEEIVDSAASLMRSDYASLQVLFPERGMGGELHLLAFRGFSPQAARLWEWVRADSKCTCGIALRDNCRVVASDIANCDFLSAEDQENYFQTGIHACQTTPLIARSGDVVGMISTHWRKPHRPSEDEFRLFDILARGTASVIERGKQNQP